MSSGYHDIDQIREKRNLSLAYALKYEVESKSQEWTWDIIKTSVCWCKDKIMP